MGRGAARGRGVGDCGRGRRVRRHVDGLNGLDGYIPGGGGNADDYRALKSITPRGDSNRPKKERKRKCVSEIKK